MFSRLCSWCVQIKIIMDASSVGSNPAMISVFWFWHTRGKDTCRSHGSDSSSHSSHLTCSTLYLFRLCQSELLRFEINSEKLCGVCGLFMFCLKEQSLGLEMSWYQMTDGCLQFLSCVSDAVSFWNVQLSNSSNHEHMGFRQTGIFKHKPDCVQTQGERAQEKGVCLYEDFLSFFLKSLQLRFCFIVTLKGSRKQFQTSVVD